MTHLCDIPLDENILVKIWWETQLLLCPNSLLDFHWASSSWCYHPPSIPLFLLTSPAFTTFALKLWSQQLIFTAAACVNNYPASASGWFVLWQRREARNKWPACPPLTSSKAQVQMSLLPIRADFLIRAALSPGYSSSVSADRFALTHYCTPPSQRRAYTITHTAFVFLEPFITVFPSCHRLKKHKMLMH